MPAPRRKRLPTDFFDRLLSNQTDDQINDLLTSLVDEQIAPIAEAAPEEAVAAAPAAITPKRRSKDFHRDKIEDSIITRDESLEEEFASAGDDALSDELIPRTARMQSGVQTRPQAGPDSARRPQSPPPAQIQEPETQAPSPAAEAAKPSIAIPGLENLVVPPELLREPEEPAQQDMGMPSFDLTATLPPRPAQAAPAASAVPAAPTAPAAPVAPEIRPSVPETPPAEPADLVPEPVPAAPLPTHEELFRARRKARWGKSERKPKTPKLATPTPPISFRRPEPSAMDLILGVKEARPFQFKLGRVSRTALLFLLPAFIGFSLFSWYPMFKGLFISLLHYMPGGASTFIGAANYARAFHDEMFWRSLLHAGWFCVLVLALGFWLPIAVSVLLNELRWGKGLLKFLFFLPFLMPTVPAAILWQWIMDQGFGLLNAVIALCGVSNPHIGWLTDPRLAMLSIAMLYIWKTTGWAVLIYSAALTNVDETLYEEAELDGANIWKKFWHVTLPCIRNVVGVMFIITIINTLQIFTEVYILTHGGPMNATEVITSYIYKQAFFYMDIGYASALSVVLLLMLLVITMFRLRRLGPEGEE